MIVNDELIKKILFHMNKETYEIDYNFKMEGYNERILSEHVRIMKERNLIEAKPIRIIGGRFVNAENYIPIRLTDNGRDKIKELLIPRWKRYLINFGKFVIWLMSKIPFIKIFVQ